MKKVQLYLSTAGHCLAKESHALKGGGRKNILFKAMFGLIKHDVLGWILFDTGYTDRFFQATKYYPSRIYANVTKVKIEKQDEVVNQLKQNGIQPEEIAHIILSHFHADHIGGLKDFPNARFYCSKIAFEHTMKLNRYLSFSKGVLKDLLPKDIQSRTHFIEEISNTFEDESLGTSYDLFGDQSILAHSLPGHAKGQIGIQISTEKQHYFLIADAAWFIEAVTENHLPNSIVRVFFSSWKDYKRSLEKVRNFKGKNPHVKIIPTHCNSTLDEVIPSKFDLHAL